MSGSSSLFISSSCSFPFILDKVNKPISSGASKKSSTTFPPNPVLIWAFNFIFSLFFIFLFFFFISLFNLSSISKCKRFSFSVSVKFSVSSTSVLSSSFSFVINFLIFSIHFKIFLKSLAFKTFKSFKQYFISSVVKRFFSINLINSSFSPSSTPLNTTSLKFPKTSTGDSAFINFSTEHFLYKRIESVSYPCLFLTLFTLKISTFFLVSFNSLKTQRESNNLGSICFCLINPSQITNISADTFLEAGGLVAVTFVKNLLNTHSKLL